MDEFLELRVKEEYAAQVFSDNEGRRLGPSIRKVILRQGDPRLREVDRLQRTRTARQDFFFAGWRLFRTYTREELENASLLQLRILTTFEPAGEECGTVYDERDACAVCGAGRRQISRLRLNLGRIPKRSDFARTIANEWIVSQRAAEVLVHEKARGIALPPVEHKAYRHSNLIDLSQTAAGQLLLSKAQEVGLSPSTWEFQVWLNSPDQSEALNRATVDSQQNPGQAERDGVTRAEWYQLVVMSQPIDISPRTGFGVDPFDRDVKRQYECPLGHTLGLNLLSELYVRQGLPTGVDVAVTRQAVGVRRGLLRPSGLVVVSQRLARILSEQGFRGFELEPVHVVP